MRTTYRSRRTILHFTTNRPIYIPIFKLLIVWYFHNNANPSTTTSTTMVVCGQDTPPPPDGVVCNVCGGDPNAVMLSPETIVPLTFIGLPDQTTMCSDIYNVGLQTYLNQAQCDAAIADQAIQTQCQCSNADLGGVPVPSTTLAPIFGTLAPVIGVPTTPAPVIGVPITPAPIIQSFTNAPVFIPAPIITPAPVPGVIISNPPTFAPVVVVQPVTSAPIQPIYVPPSVRVPLNSSVRIPETTET
jgi:hypothetical protein